MTQDKTLFGKRPPPPPPTTVIVHRLDPQLHEDLHRFLDLYAKSVNAAGEAVTDADKTLARDIRDLARGNKLSAEALDEKTPSAAEPGA